MASGLPRDQRGTSTVELAFVVPLIVFLILAAVDYSLGFAFKLSLEQAATRTIHQAISQGEVNGDYAYLLSAASAASSQPESNITLDRWLTCDGVRQPAFDGACESHQRPSRFVRLRIKGKFTPPFDFGPIARFYGGTSMSEAILEGSARVEVQ